MCVSAAANPTIGVSGGYADRCGPGPRLPLLVISPYAKTNFVDHTPTEQGSILAFIEDNWKTGRHGDGSGRLMFTRHVGTVHRASNWERDRFSRGTGHSTFSTARRCGWTRTYR